MIEVKYNIDFKKALKVLEEQGFEKYINQHFADRTAKLARDFIKDGKVKPKLSKNNPRGQKAKPLFDTGKLANSLKGTSKGITGVDYAKEHRKQGGYAWKGLQVPQREYIPHLKDGKIALRGTKSNITKIYEDFKKKFVRLLNKRIRKK
jgi:hypothetical protein